MSIHVSAFPTHAVAFPYGSQTSAMVRFRGNEGGEDVDIYLHYLPSSNLRAIAAAMLRAADVADEAAHPVDYL